MSYCDKWRLLGLAIGLAPVFLALFIAFVIGRWPRRFWIAALLGPLAGMTSLVVSYPMVLILWNGIRPAICDRI